MPYHLGCKLLFGTKKKNIIDEMLTSQKKQLALTCQGDHILSSSTSWSEHHSPPDIG